MQGTTFKEQIIMADNNHISYRILGDKPIAQHRGDIYLKANNAQPSLTEVSQALKKIACYFKEKRHEH